MLTSPPNGKPVTFTPGVGSELARSRLISTLGPTAPAPVCCDSGACQNGVAGIGDGEPGYAGYAGVRGVDGSSPMTLSICGCPEPLPDPGLKDEREKYESCGLGMLYVVGERAYVDWNVTDGGMNDCRLFDELKVASEPRLPAVGVVDPGVCG